MTAWRNKTVLITGHTGFKGSWLIEMLFQLGAEVHGIALEPDEEPNLFSAANLSQRLASNSYIDIRDENRLTIAISEIQPDFIFHLAGQSIVSKGFDYPKETFDINTIGTVNVLVSSLNSKKLKGTIFATTDKVYENLENRTKKTEKSPLGGVDPYSGSKASAEIAIKSLAYLYRARDIKMGIVRAGNVIGGGDWSKDRLIPDVYRSVMNDTTLNIRNPNSTRPWQHVLDCLHGYLLAGSRILREEQQQLLEIYNFGPTSSLSVHHLLQILTEVFPVAWIVDSGTQIGYEHQQLSLDSTKAYGELGWQCKMNIRDAIIETATWYNQFIKGEDPLNLLSYSVREFFINEN